MTSILTYQVLTSSVDVVLTKCPCLSDIWTCDIKDVECKMELFCLMHLSLKHFFSPTLCLLYYQKHIHVKNGNRYKFSFVAHICIRVWSTVSQYYFKKFYNCILIIFKHVSIMIIIVEIRRYLECSIRNRFLMEQYKTDSPVTTFINRSKVWWLPWYYIIVIHSWISPLQTEEKQSEWTDNDGQSPILGSHRPRKQRQRRGWRVLIL